MTDRYQQPAIATNWRCGGERVHLARRADIPRPFKPSAPYSDTMRRALATIPPVGQDRFIGCAELQGEQMLPLTIGIGSDYPREWAIHMDHQARRPGLSPFATLPAHQLPSLMTSLLSLEIIRDGERLLLVRAYPGQYVPPLPSMMTAKNAPGGVAACEAYWREHAYLVTDHVNRISPDTTSSTPPPWF